jgi:BlaI family penicillinase repressor
MDVLYRRGSSTVAEVMAELPDPPSYSAVRATLRILEEKGHVRHREDGPRYVYLPEVPRQSAQESALKHLVSTFFNGSTEAAMAALLDMSSERISDAELKRLARLIEHAREQGR